MNGGTTRNQLGPRHLPNARETQNPKPTKPNQPPSSTLQNSPAQTTNDSTHIYSHLGAALQKATEAASKSSHTQTTPIKKPSRHKSKATSHPSDTRPPRSSSTRT